MNYEKLLKDVPTEALRAEIKRRTKELTAEYGPLAIRMVLRPCPYCGELFGARALLRHDGVCSKSPYRDGVQAKCPHCKRKFDGRGLRRHVPACPKNPERRAA